MPHGQSPWSIPDISLPRADYLHVVLEKSGAHISEVSQANLGSLGCLPSQWKERGTFGRVIWFGWVNLPLKLPLSLCCLEESPADWSEMSFRWGSEINPTFS